MRQYRPEIPALRRIREVWGYLWLHSDLEGSQEKYKILHDNIYYTYINLYMAIEYICIYTHILVYTWLSNEYVCNIFAYI